MSSGSYECPETDSSINSNFPQLPSRPNILIAEAIRDVMCVGGLS